MIILSNRMSVHSPLPSVIHIGDADVPFVSSVKNLGVTLDSNLSMSQHISNTCKAAYIQIRHISSIRHLLTTQATQTLICSLVLSRLDYCNSLLSGCPQYLLDKLQKVQNAAARLVCKAKKSDHIHPILATLHWLPVTHRIQYKISTICFNSISGTAPQYLSDLLQPYTPARQLRSASDTRTFVTPRVNTKTFGERSFSYAGPSVWNRREAKKLTPVFSKTDHINIIQWFWWTTANSSPETNRNVSTARHLDQSMIPYKS